MPELALLVWENGVKNILSLVRLKVLIKMGWTNESGMRRNHLFAATVQIAGKNHDGNPFIVVGIPGAPFTKNVVLYWGKIGIDCTESPSKVIFGWNVGRECDEFLFAHINRGSGPRTEVSIINS